jgi:2'-5' RNA ligase
VSNLVIVAIPDENDRVWKVSSEKIPHLTMLFLGDVDQISNLETIVQFVEHAADTTLNRFHMTVDRRGELGADQADVLFFKKDRYAYKAARDFRASLLQDNNIKTAYDSTTQFDGPWNPHLTLGYPAAPAKPKLEDYPFYEVSFNKIAVWTGDFDGPEFLLKDYFDEFDALETVPMDVAMSDISHHGVKGMKWGVRKVEGGGKGAHIRVNEKTGKAALSTQSTVAIAGTAVIFPPLVPAAFLSSRIRAEVKAARAVNKGVRADKKLGKEEEKFRKHAMQASNFVAIHNGALEKINREIVEHTKKYPDLSQPATKKAYDDAVLKSMQNGYRESANSLVNKKNTMHLDVEFKNDGYDFVIHAKEGRTGEAAGSPCRW